MTLRSPPGRHPVRWGAAAVLVGTWLLLASPFGLAGHVPDAHGAGPTPSPAVAGDTRSAGEGPGLVGSPLLAVAVVLGLGALAALLATTYVRLTAPPASDGSDEAYPAGRPPSDGP